MRTLTIDEYRAELKAQGTPSGLTACMVCPACGTIQNAQDLINAGAGADFAAVQQYIGFSCVGRWTKAGSPPKEKGTQKGCNWTLGGLFRIHELEVVTPDGEKHPVFEIATKEQAAEHCEKQRGS